MIPTEPGIYRDVSVDDYNAIDAVRRSFLWKLYDRSPGHAVYQQEHPMESEALTDGTMVHTSVLQPEEFPRRYAVLPPFEDDPENTTKDGSIPKSPRATGYYKGKKAMFEAMSASAGTEIVDSRKYEMAYQLGKRIREHKVCGRFFKRGSSNEATAVWVDPDTGIMCKARYDCLVEEGMPTAVDLKTTADAHPRSFAHSIRKFGYHFQAAFYLEGLIANGLSNPNFLIVAGEKSAPYPVVTYQCEAETLALGRKHFQEALRTYAKCVESGQWPYYGDAIETLQLSEWDLKELENA